MIFLLLLLLLPQLFLCINNNKIIFIYGQTPTLNYTPYPTPSPIENTRDMDYYFVYENPPINWIQAEEICRDRYKSHLGSISTQRELNYIKSTLGYGELFIGLNDINNEGLIIWEDDVTITQTFWALNQPLNDNNLDCGLLRFQNPASTSDGFVLISCSTIQLNNFICNKPHTNNFYMVKPVSQIGWNQANSYCITNYGTNLSTIITPNDHIALNYISQGVPYMIGYKRNGGNNLFYWVSSISSSYISWLNSIEPAPSASDTCIYADSKGKWVGFDCNTASISIFFCDKPSKHKEYHRTLSISNWYGAESNCYYSYGTSLPTITNINDLNWLYSLITISTTNGASFIGLNDIENEGEYRWSSEEKNVEYFNWGIGEGTNVNEDCVYMDVATKNYIDFTCTVQHGSWHGCDKKPVREYYVEKLSYFIRKTQGEELCKSKYGTHLATIKRPEEITMLQSITGGGSYWTGLTLNSSKNFWLSGEEFGSSDSSLIYDNLFPSNIHVLISVNVFQKTDNGPYINYLVCDRVKPREYIKILSPTPLSWDQAENDCSTKYGSHLATIETSEDRSYLLYETLGFSYYIGLNDKGIATKHKWSSGENLGLYTQWKSGLVLNGDEDCVASIKNIITFKDDWVEISCSLLFYDLYFCDEPEVKQYYKHITSTLSTWDSFETLCQTKYGTNLGTVTNLNEIYEIGNWFRKITIGQNHIYNAGITIGLNDKIKEGRRVWNSGYVYSSYYPWITGHPFEDNLDPTWDCVELSYTKDVLNSGLRFFVSAKCNQNWFYSYICDRPKARKYFIISQTAASKTLSVSSIECSSLASSSLPTVNTLIDSLYIYKITRQNGYYIGLSNKFGDGILSNHYGWTSFVKNSGYTNWGIAPSSGLPTITSSIDSRGVLVLNDLSWFSILKSSSSNTVITVCDPIRTYFYNKIIGTYSWDNANQQCFITHGSTLATIKNEYDLGYLMSLTVGINGWVGLISTPTHSNTWSSKYLGTYYEQRYINDIMPQPTPFFGSYITASGSDMTNYKIGYNILAQTTITPTIPNVFCDQTQIIQTKSPTSPTVKSPTKNPTIKPTTKSPTKNPTLPPTTKSPTKNPTKYPTLSPSKTPTTKSPVIISPTISSPSRLIIRLSLEKHTGYFRDDICTEDEFPSELIACSERFPIVYGWKNNKFKDPYNIINYYNLNGTSFVNYYNGTNIFQSNIYTLNDGFVKTINYYANILYTSNLRHIWYGSSEFNCYDFKNSASNGYVIYITSISTSSLSVIRPCQFFNHVQCGCIQSGVTLSPTTKSPTKNPTTKNPGYVPPSISPTPFGTNPNTDSINNYFGTSKSFINDTINNNNHLIFYLVKNEKKEEEEQGIKQNGDIDNFKDISKNMCEEYIKDSIECSSIEPFLSYKNHRIVDDIPNLMGFNPFSTSVYTLDYLYYNDTKTIILDMNNKTTYGRSISYMNFVYGNDDLKDGPNPYINFDDAKTIWEEFYTGGIIETMSEYDYLNTNCREWKSISDDDYGLTSILKRSCNSSGNCTDILIQTPLIDRLKKCSGNNNISTQSFFYSSIPCLCLLGTRKPTSSPTNIPTKSPILKTKYPTTNDPTESPTTKSPTTSIPTIKPTTSIPTKNPISLSPTKKPTTLLPTKKPTTLLPTLKPTLNPTLKPTLKPTLSPSKPTLIPTFETNAPTLEEIYKTSNVLSYIASTPPYSLVYNTNKKIYTNKKYIVKSITPTIITWQDAENDCLIKYGTHLATFHTIEEINEGLRLTLKNSFYIGFKYSIINNEWRWNSNIYPIILKRWKINEPSIDFLISIPQKICSYINKIGLFVSYPCNTIITPSLEHDVIKYYICDPISKLYSIRSSSTTLSWNDSNNICLNIFGTSLGTLNNIYEINHLNHMGINIFTDSFVNIGLYTDNTKSSWYWKSGKSASNILNYYTELSFWSPSKLCNYHVVNSTIFSYIECSLGIATHHYICDIKTPNYIFEKVKGNIAISWNEAERICNEKYNSHLATIFYENELDILLEWSNGELFYIGLNDKTKENIYMWSSGLISKTNYFPWDTTVIHNNINENCVYINNNGKYLTIPCSSRNLNIKNYVCDNKEKRIVYNNNGNVLNYHTMISSINISWERANKECLYRYGSTLATIETIEDLYELNIWANGNSYAIGLKYFSSSSSIINNINGFYWISSNKINYNINNKWLNGYPLNPSLINGCVYVNELGYLYNSLCTTNNIKYFVCEGKPKGVQLYLYQSSQKLKGIDLMKDSLSKRICQKDYLKFENQKKHFRGGGIPLISYTGNFIVDYPLLYNFPSSAPVRFINKKNNNNNNNNNSTKNGISEWFKSDLIINSWDILINNNNENLLESLKDLGFITDYKNEINFWTGGITSQSSTFSTRCNDWNIYLNNNNNGKIGYINSTKTGTSLFGSSSNQHDFLSCDKSLYFLCLGIEDEYQQELLTNPFSFYLKNGNNNNNLPILLFQSPYKRKGGELLIKHEKTGISVSETDCNIDKLYYNGYFKCKTNNGKAIPMISTKDNNILNFHLKYNFQILSPVIFIKNNNDNNNGIESYSISKSWKNLILTNITTKISNNYDTLDNSLYEAGFIKKDNNDDDDDYWTGGLTGIDNCLDWTSSLYGKIISNTIKGTTGSIYSKNTGDSNIDNNYMDTIINKNLINKANCEAEKNFLCMCPLDITSSPTTSPMVTLTNQPTSTFRPTTLKPTKNPIQPTNYPRELIYD